MALPSVFTIHNMAFQGLFPPDRLAGLGLPDALLQPDGLEFWGKISFLKSGIFYANRVTTVSPTYAGEIATADFGCGLDGVVRSRGAAVSGILNGVDDAVWNPASDRLIEATYDIDGLERRDANRAALLTGTGLSPPTGPLLGVVSRLTEQKGLDLLLAALPVLLARGGALALLGSGDAALEARFAAAAREHPDRVWVKVGYDDQLSHRLIAGADAIVVPSRFEPCGLTQLYALRYGAVPIVRRTGGLADTVTDVAAARPDSQSETGFVFDQPSAEALGVAIGRAATLLTDKVAWRVLQQNGMRQRFSWREAAADYGALYRAVTRA
jgi:starch synthase